MAAEKRKTVSLVLGSGGARGLAHIGVIRYLEQQDYDIRSISGCSMGAVVGGIHAAGKLAEFEKWVRAIDRMDILSLLDLSWQMDGLVKGEKIMTALRKLVGEHDIEHLPVRFTAVAADMSAEKEVWLQHGSLFDAMRASMSLPLFFTPFEYRGRRLIDGGVLNPVPIAPTFSDHNDLTIAVNLGGRPVKRSETASAAGRHIGAGTAAANDSAIRRSIAEFVGGLKDRLNAGDTSDQVDVLEIASMAFDAMQSTISRQKLAAYPPDRVVTISRSAATVLEFDRAEEMIELGYREARRQLA